MHRILVLATVVLALSSAASAEDLLTGLRKEHPRIGLDTGRLAHVRGLIASDPVAQKVYSDRLRRARAILKEPVSLYEKPDGKRLLHISRRVLDRVTTLAFVRWMENDPAFAARAWAELDAAAEFPDWNPSHFLDTAEMTRAFGIGYDWLYHDWTSEQRARLERAIVEKGIQPAFLEYESKKPWVTCDHNWNQVCHSGLGIGALAIADRFPDEAARVLEQAFNNLPIATRAYGPDGAGLEGPTYWTYGCGFQVAFLDALQTALGSDRGLSDSEDLRRSGSFHLYLSGVSPRTTFDFEDAGSAKVSDTAHFWLARRYGEPSYAWLRYRALEETPGNGNAWDLLWFDPSGRTFDPSTLPLDRHYRHAECASMRSSWTDPEPLVLAMQGGDNTFNHWHLDLGSFILEAGGVRWIIDSGVEKETYQAHRHRLPRWSFYRVRAEGHNTLVLQPAASTNGPDQHPKGTAAFTAFESEPDYAKAELDLSAGYRPHAESVKRTYELVDGRHSVVLTDRVRAAQPVELWWFAHTEAEVETAPDGRSALLRQRGKTMRVDLVSGPPDASIGVMPARPLPGSPDPSIQNPNEGRRKLFIHQIGVTNLDLVVRFTPL